MVTEHGVLLSAIIKETKSAQNIHQHTCCIHTAQLSSVRVAAIRKNKAKKGLNPLKQHSWHVNGEILSYLSSTKVLWCWVLTIKARKTIQWFHKLFCTWEFVGSSIMYLVNTETQNRTNPSCGAMSFHNSTPSDIYICLGMTLSQLDKVAFIGSTSKINVKILWQMSVREKNQCGNRIDGADGNWSIFLTWRQLCVLKDFGLAFKIHEGPVKTYVSQYT